MDLAAFPPPPEARASEGIAVIPIHDTLVKRILGMEATSGLTSHGEIASMLDAALADRDDALLVARHAIVARNALVWPACINSLQKAAAEEQLVGLGVLVRESA